MILQKSWCRFDHDRSLFFITGALNQRYMEIDITGLGKLAISALFIASLRLYRCEITNDPYCDVFNRLNDIQLRGFPFLPLRWSVYMIRLTRKIEFLDRLPSNIVVLPIAGDI